MRDLVYSPVLVRLLQGVVDSEAKEDWNILLSNQTPIMEYLETIGLELILNEVEGFAYLKQQESDGFPKLLRKNPLSYGVTLLCVLLRERLQQFDSNTSHSAKLVIEDSEIKEMLRPFLPKKSDEVKQGKEIGSLINKALELGFLRQLKEAVPPAYEVRRILKAKLTVESLKDIKERLEGYAARSVEQ